MTIASDFLLDMYELHGDEDIEFYRDLEDKYLAAKALFYERLHDDLTEEEISGIVYDIGNTVYGNKNLRLFFTSIYSILFHTVDGPRLPDFIAIVTPSEFLRLLAD